MIGRTVSHYRVVDKLGEGGMGVVYKARDLHLPRFVALKCLPPHLAASSSEMARLEREAEAICTLNHPHVAVIHGIENADGRKFLVLEYLPGGTLKQQVEARGPDGPPMPLAQALDYAIQIGEGLAHAHSKGIVHRDVKTANALLTEDGAVKITDFGLSGSQGSPEGTGIHGTPAYMSTEQARGETADERSDIFSFGVVLFELVTGHLPFEAPDPEATLRMILDTPAPTLKRYREGVPESLERIVARSLAKDRRERYSRMDDVLADLRPELDKLRAKSRQQTMPIKPVKKRKWRRLLAAAGALAVLVVALCLAIWLWPKPRHLAVLPFTVVDSDAANQRFADVLGETVSNKLTQLSRYHRSLRIVPVSDLRAEAISSPTKARRIFHAELAITGMVRRQGDRLLVTVNLIDGRTESSRRLSRCSRWTSSRKPGRPGPKATRPIPTPTTITRQAKATSPAGPAAPITRSRCSRRPSTGIQAMRWRMRAWPRPCFRSTPRPRISSGWSRPGGTPIGRSRSALRWLPYG
ncbi:MAG: protein kinase [Acidobacteria bacterium]|nr:protein kinase [Acidobacteriota bacterium]